MPELPDVTAYVEALETHVVGQTLEKVRLGNPFLLRSVDPPLGDVEGRELVGARRIAKRIVLELEGELFCVLHLMIAGRLRWQKKGAGLPGKRGLAAFDFERGTLMLTEASSKKRASLFLVRGEDGLAEHDRGGLEPLTASLEQFTAALTEERHTVKRSLTDPRILAGIGNSYSDEILHAARLSPTTLTTSLDAEQLERLWRATRETLEHWIARTRDELDGAFPDKVTAFRDGMAVHGRHKEPCPVCGDPVQRIAYADNETNYCATCQTGGKLLKDRALSRLLREDWPKTLDELESR